MSTRKKRKPIVIDEAGVHVRLFKHHYGRYWLDVSHGGRRTRQSTETSDRAAAETRAREFAREIAKQDLLGIVPETLTIGQLFGAYHEHKGKALEGQWKRGVERRRADFLAAWGEPLTVASISQTTVDRYSAVRRKAFVEKQRAAHVAIAAALRARAERRGKPLPVVPQPAFRQLRDGALDPDYRWLSSVFNWAMRHKLPNGKRLLSYNPLHDCTWPREQNIRRPIASHERYVETLAKADAVDSAGRFRLALVLARYTARRIDAIVHLRTSDALRSTDRIRAALAEAGQDERLADDMKHGAIRWRQQHDKQGVERITPISDTVRNELDRYLENASRVGEAWMFPRDNTPADMPEQPITRTIATNWLRKAERLAELPKLRGGLWHAYRRLWATERKSLPDVDVAEAGGWTGTKAMKLAYQKHTPEGVLAAVLNAG